MLKFDETDVALDVEATSKQQVIEHVAQQLQQAGKVKQGYLQGMLAREQQTITYLGEGIAIPHGTTDTRALVITTGLSVVRLKQPVDWGEQQPVTVVIGIAAKSDEHLDVLRQLTRILTNPEQLKQLKSGSAAEIVALLTRQQAPTELTIDASLVQLQQPCSSLTQARAQAVTLLQDAGYVDGHYLGDTLTREISTLDHISDGIWLVRSQHGVHTPSLAWVGLAEPITWREQPVRAVLALATQGQAHLSLLTRLQAMREQHQLTGLTTAHQAQQLTMLLRQGVNVGPSETVTVLNPHGLHARPSAMLVQAAKKTGVPIYLENLTSGSDKANAASLTQILGLGARHGDQLRLSGAPETPLQAIQQIAEAITAGLGEATQPVPTAEPQEGEAPANIEAPSQPATIAPNTVTTAIGAAPGMALGTVVIEHQQSVSITREASDPTAELAHFEQALQHTLDELKTKAEQSAKEDVRTILSMHCDLLSDPELVDASRQLIEGGTSAAWAWHHCFDKLAQQQARSTNSLLAERAADIRDVGARVLQQLLPSTEQDTLSEGSVLFIEDISPSRVAELDPKQIAAVVCAHGGATSHAAILARAAGLPMVVGAGPGILDVEPGQSVIVDGTHGAFILAPDDERKQQTQQAIAQQQQLLDAALSRRFAPATTQDGHTIEVAANLGDSHEVEQAVAQGCDGVGLLRTEFLFMHHSHEPTEQEQIRHYQQVFDGLGDKPLVVRTLDIGGDKPLTYLPMVSEENPFLGIRGIRLCLRRPALLKRQLTALLKASDGRPLRIMFPMVSDINEWRAARTLFTEAAGNMDTAHVQLGMMIEIPSAALRAADFAREVDFFSIGTNDLTQYTLAIDRGHPDLSAQADALHPAVLSLIDMTVRAAHSHGAWVGVCGEAAADALGAAVFTGLGVDELSMSARAIPLIKEQLRQGNYATYQQLASKALQQADAQSVRMLREQQA